MNALDQLTELMRYVEQSTLETRQLKAEIVALQERVGKLEAAASPKRRTAEPAGAPATPPRSEPVIHVRREPAAASVSPRLSKVEPAWTARLTAAYAEAALDLTGAGERFITEFAPVAATRNPGQDTYTLGGDPYAAMLWAVPADGDAHALLPGYKAVLNWSSLLAPNRTTTAAEFLGHAFDLEPVAGRFAVAAPAFVSNGPSGLLLTAKGRVSGFRN